MNDKNKFRYPRFLEPIDYNASKCTKRLSLFIELSCGEVIDERVRMLSIIAWDCQYLTAAGGFHFIRLQNQDHRSKIYDY